MQVGNRTRVSQSPGSFRIPGESPLNLEGQSPEAPRSAARLAADEAFSAPESLPPNTNQPVVIVRRARVLSRDLDISAPDSATPVHESEGKAPRVFRVESNADLLPDELRPVLSASPAQDHAQDVVHVPRKRRIAVDKRPGPVVHVLQDPGRLQPDAEAGSNGLASSPGRPLDELVGELAGVDRIFEAIRRAQAFQMNDERFAGEWRRVSLAADELQRQIESQIA
jgi:hypothetical protein